MFCSFQFFIIKDIIKKASTHCYLLLFSDTVSYVNSVTLWFRPANARNTSHAILNWQEAQVRRNSWKYQSVLISQSFLVFDVRFRPEAYSQSYVLRPIQTQSSFLVGLCHFLTYRVIRGSSRLNVTIHSLCLSSLQTHQVLKETLPWQSHQPVRTKVGCLT